MYPRHPNFPVHVLLWFIPLIIFDVIIRGMALWRASRRGEKWWFIGLFVINSLGILPLIYLLTHADVKKPSSKK